MNTGEWPDAENVSVFGPGREGQILLRAGGTLEVKPSDVINYNSLGIVIVHGEDKYDTMTFIPFNNIGWVRTKELSPGKRFLERVREEREKSDKLELPEPRYLGEGEWSDGL